MDLTQTIMFLLIGLVVGFILGAIVAVLFREDGDQAKSAGAPKGHVEVLRVWWDKQSESILPEIGGKYPRNAALLTEAQHAHLIRVILSLRQWMGYNPAAAEPEPTPQRAAAAPQARGAPGEEAPPNISPVTAFAESLPKPVGYMDALRSNPFKRPQIASPKTAEEARPKSIVEQIDEILQTQIASTPLTARAVALKELPSGGMVIFIGRQQYEGVDAIPDPEIKAAIKRAAQTWNPIPPPRAGG